MAFLRHAAAIDEVRSERVACLTVQPWKMSKIDDDSVPIELIASPTVA